MSRWRMLLVAGAVAGAVLACDRGQETVLVITATFLPPTLASEATGVPPAVSEVAPFVPTPSPVQGAAPTEALTYVVQTGDTLTGIALANNTTLDTLLRLNGLNNPDQLLEGQTLILPGRPAQMGPANPLLPDGLLVRGPASAGFDSVAFAEGQPGGLRDLRERVDGIEMTGPAIVERISREFGVDARVLLAMLEFRSSLLSAELTPDREQYPVFSPAQPGDVGRVGLYRQLAWTADRLNGGYYGRKYRGLDLVELTDGARFLLPEELQPGTSAIHSMFSKIMDEPQWTAAVSPDGYLSVYTKLFGDPWSQPPADPIRDTLVQPELSLPFSEDEVWYFTGGPHGGWGSGSAWAAVDFAPPDNPETVDGPCYVSSHFVTAVGDGVIARSVEGVVVLDLDGDGNETTGWTVMYLHIDRLDRVAQGAQVKVGDHIGRPSCEGGVSNGTHAHLARRYNGEWLPASCMECSGTAAAPPPMVLGGWQVVDLPGREYQGYLVAGDELRIAEAARGVAPNEISGASVVN